MIAHLRTAGRLAHALAHLLHGLLVVMFRFPALDAAARHARIGAWSLRLLRALGVDVQLRGRPGAGAALIVANHVSWLDIMAMHSLCPEARFVCKSEVAAWPLVGRLVAGAGTLFVQRQRPRDTVRVVDQIGRALRRGETVALFPEGTTGDGRGVLDFHAGLLQSAVDSGCAVQAIALRYADEHSAVSVQAPYAGGTTLAQSLWRVCSARGLVVHLVVLAPHPAPHGDRRTLARALRADIGGALAAMPDAGAPRAAAPILRLEEMGREMSG